MPTISRGIKSSAGGGTAFADATVIQAAEFNTDFDTVYNLLNGLLDGDNIVDITDGMLSASADITATKIGDISATSAAHDDTTTPGDSSSHTLPTTLSGELQQLRYVVERQALGIAPDRVDGSGTGAAGWYDLPARGPNLLKSPNFNTGTFATTTPPANWTDLGTGTPTFSASTLTGATLTEGKGVELRIQAGSAAVAGVTQTLSGLKASTRYLVVARARSTTGAVHLKTTGADATSSFRNIDDSSSSTTYVTLKGVIQTDSTPTNVVVQLTTNGGNGDDVKFSFAGVYECAADHVLRGSTTTESNVLTSSYDVLAASFDNPSTNVRVRCPGDGFEIEVQAQIPLENTSGTDRHVGIFLNENGAEATGGYVEVLVRQNTHALATIYWKNLSPTPGTAYTYQLSCRASGGSAGDVKIPGTSVVTGGGTKALRLYARAVRVSE